MLGLLAAITAVVWPPLPALRLGVLLAWGLLIVGLSSARRRAPTAFLRDWVCVPLVVSIYVIIDPLVSTLAPWRLDGWLAAFDVRVFGPLVPAWQGALGRPGWFTDAVYLVYASYYLMPVLVAAMAWMQDDSRFEKTIIALLLIIHATYIGYLLLPAVGPRLSPGIEDAALGGGAISRGVRLFLRHAETTTLDAFPSGHTAVSMVSAALGARLYPRLTALFWAWCAAIVFSTVYIHVHYAADLLAGALLAAAVLLVLPHSMGIRAMADPII
jgi:membrane-associated phospholipid phosphatase